MLNEDFYHMVQHSITHGHFPPRMTLGTIVLLFKTSIHVDLSNWCPITLLNVTYKIIAKASQIKLQSLFEDVIS